MSAVGTAQAISAANQQIELVCPQNQMTSPVAVTVHNKSSYDLTIGSPNRLVPAWRSLSMPLGAYPNASSGQTVVIVTTMLAAGVTAGPISSIYHEWFDESDVEQYRLVDLQLDNETVAGADPPTVTILHQPYAAVAATGFTTVLLVPPAAGMCWDIRQLTLSAATTSTSVVAVGNIIGTTSGLSYLGATAQSSGVNVVSSSMYYIGEGLTVSNAIGVNLNGEAVARQAPFV